MNTDENNEMNKYSERVVAFVDILGFKIKVEDTILDNKASKKLHSALKSISGWQIENEQHDVFSLKEIGIT